MQQKHNWILLNKHDSLHDQPANSKRIIYHKPIVVSTPGSAQFVHRPTREALDRISSINRLNDRIRRRLEDSDIYASTSVLDDGRKETTSGEEFTGASEASRRRATRVVDEHFDFIREETDDVPTPTIPQEDYLVQERNSHGSIDAVFEKRSPQGNPDRPYRRQQRSLTDPLHDPRPSMNDDAKSSPVPRHLIHNVPIQMLKKRADSLDSGSTRLGYVIDRDPNPTPRTPSDWQTPAVSQKPSFQHKRRESFQPRQRQYRHRPFLSSNRPSFAEHDVYRTELDRIPRRASKRITRRPARMMPRKTPSLLRRDSYFYKKCDICFNEPRPDGVPCPACNSFSPRHRNLRRYSRNFDYQLKPSKAPSRMPSNRHSVPPPVTIEPYFEDIDEEGGGASSSSSEAAPGQPWTSHPPRTASQTGFYPNNPAPRRHKILSAESLQRHPSYLVYARGPGTQSYMPMRPHSPPASRQSTVIWPANAGPAWKSIDHRPRASPVFRYGKAVPKWLYDYDAYAEEQRQKEIERRKQKVIALTLVFLFFALVVAAGVVLAALN